MKKYLFLIIIIFLATRSFSQQKNRFIIKSNLLNLIAKNPAISIEKAFSNTFSLEASYVSGKTNILPFTDQYAYKGFLLRTKKYLSETKINDLNLYYGYYVGNLNREIKSAGYAHQTGFFGIASRDFTSNSVRSGGSLGVAYQLRNNIVFDASASLGYGRYFNTKNNNATNFPPKGYLDTQIWFSVGYGF